MSTPKNLRNRKGSIKDPKDSSDCDFSVLLRETEERMKSFFKEEIKGLHDRMSSIESSILSLKNECIRLDDNLLSMREVIVAQQKQIEKHESKFRERNLIVHNIPESDVINGIEKLKSDTDKLAFLCKASNIEIKANDISSSRRLGRQKSGKPRPIKIELGSKDAKYKLLNKRREILRNENLIKTFGRKIFVNPDQSFLVQREELRLRGEQSRLKSENPDSSVYLRSGVLYLNNSPVDRINVAHQLF